MPSPSSTSTYKPLHCPLKNSSPYQHHTFNRNHFLTVTIPFEIISRHSQAFSDVAMAPSTKPITIGEPDQCV
ncbi:polyprenyl synthetase [Sesbania bispinosa]|nr:polyprenyl synthetase [Sesbania bispinosa]